MNLDSGAIAGIIIAVVIFVVVVAFLSSAANIVQQGYVGVVKTLGEFKSIRNPGLAIIFPIAQTLVRVDMREIPRPGDRQEVITKDNVVVAVNATIFTQVVDAKQALFSVSNFDVAIDAPDRRQAGCHHARQRHGQRQRHHLQPGCRAEAGPVQRQ